MKGDIVARRYAHALFSLGRESGEATLDLYGKALSALAELTEASPDLARAFRAPVISTAEKRNCLGISPPASMRFLTRKRASRAGNWPLPSP